MLHIRMAGNAKKCAETETGSATVALFHSQFSMSCFSTLTIFLSVSLFLVEFSLGYLSIEEFGAVADDPSLDACRKNSKAFQDAMTNGSASVVPPGKEFYTLPVVLENVHNVEFKIQGDIVAYGGNISDWTTGRSGRLHLFHFTKCSHIRVFGNGTIDGQGYRWWKVVLLNKDHKNRPKLLQFNQCSHLEFYDFKMKNSPYYHLHLQDVVNVTIRGIDIRVDVFKQKELLHQHSLMQTFNGINVPLFPLNTDGIDPQGRDIVIENVYIECYDDAIAVKPSQAGDKLSQCTENVVVRNATIKYGVGLSIGSVPPGTNCVRNVSFYDSVFYDPFKAIYIKSNPGSHGKGIISNILYQNITAYNPIWFGIYIGPQQQKEPDGKGPGCMLYPIRKDCPTNPLVTMENITLRDVYMKNAILNPGIVRCNASNPCKNFVFENVQATGLLQRFGYICENVQATNINSHPIPCPGVTSVER